MQNRIIGGEFDIDLRLPLCGPGDAGSLDSVFRYSSGRSAIYHVMLDIRKRFGRQVVMLPDYLCSSVLHATKMAGMTVMFYSLDDCLEFDRDSFAQCYRADAAVLLINYFGLTDVQRQAQWIRTLDKDALLVEDDVQSYFEFVKPLGAVDYKLTSLRKTFACPDGGLVKSKVILPQPVETNSFYQYKVAGGLLKSLKREEYYSDSIYLDLLKKGEDQIDHDIDRGMSALSANILSRVDTELVAAKRRKNGAFVLAGLGKMGISPIVTIEDGKVPLFIPIKLKNRDEVRQALFIKNIFCPVHWPTEGLPIRKGVELEASELSIIIDQRYDEEDMTRILAVLEENVR